MTVLPKRNASKSKAETNSDRLEKKRWLSRALKLETLEKRELFAADLPAFHNGLIPQDVDLDYAVGPLDALAVINSLNERGSTYLGGASNDSPNGFVDVDGDDFLTPLDALSVINFINSGEGVGELASIRYQFFAANPDGTPNLNRLLGQTDGPTAPVIDIGVGEQIVIRTQVNDLRNQNVANPLRRYGVFSAYHDLRYENVDGSTDEKLELMWGEYNEVFIPSSVTSGSFQLRYAAGGGQPERIVQITPSYVSTGGLNFASTRVAIFNALETAFGAGNIRITTPSPVRDGFLGFGFNFQRSLSRVNIVNAEIINNTLSASGTPIDPLYTNDANPSPTSLRTTVPARNHALENTFVNAFGNTIDSDVSYIDGVDGKIRPPVNVRLATIQNHVLTTNNFDDLSSIEDINTIDGITVSPGDRILVRAQTNPAQNGIYVVADRTNGVITKRTLIRALDADQSSELIDAFAIVTSGTRSGQRFLQKTPNVNLGTSPIVWGDPNVMVLERFGGFSGKEIEDNFGATQYFNVIDVLFRAGKAGVVELDAELSEVPTGTNPNVTQNLGLALHSTTSYITDPTLIILPTNVRIRILDELTAFPDRYTLNEDAPGTLLDVMGGSEPDVDRLGRSFSIVGVNNTSDKATVTVANNGTRVLFTPAADANGEVVFTYTIRNSNGNEAVGTVTVNLNAINDAPFALTPTLSVNEDRPTPGLVITPATLFSAGPADEIAAGQTVSLTGTPTSPNGTVTIDADGNLSFVPALNFFGPATVTVTGRDSVGAERQAVFTITVTPVNDAPIAGTRSFQTNEDTALPAIAATTLFTPGPSNESSQTVTLSVPTPPPTSQGTVTLPNNGTSLVFNPAPNFFGDVVFAVRGTDNGVGTAANPTAPNPQVTDSMITIRVSPVNDAPTAANDSLSAIAAVGIAQPLDVMALGSASSGRDSAGPLEDVPGGDTIRVVRVTQPVNAANANARGGTVAVGTDGANVTFTPDGSIIDGVVTFTYTIRDLGGAANGLESTATVTLRIVPPARPYALDDSFTIDEDSGNQSFDVLNGSNADFVRPNSTAELVSVSSIPDTQGTVSPAANLVAFRPADNFFGTVVFTYNMRDTSGLPPETDSRVTANVTVLVRELNDAPVAVELTRTTPEDIDLLMAAGSLTDGLSRGAPNESSQTLTITNARLVDPAAGTIERRRNGDFFDIFFDPADNFFGQAIIEYTVTDNGTDRGVSAPRSSTSRILVNVTPTNDAPITVNKSFTAVEDTPRLYSIASIIANDLPGPINERDVLNQTVTFDGLPSMTSARGGTLEIVGNDVRYTPARDFFGVDTFTYRVRDNASPALTTIGTVTVTVSEINDTPVATNVSRGGIFASVRTVIDLSAELAQMSRGAANESNQTLRIVAVSASANGVQPTIGADGVSIIYTAPLGANGPDSFTYTIEDNGTDNGTVTPRRSTATANVTVLPFIPSSFRGTVWIDEDAKRNNIIDNGELFVSGADVYLFEGTMENQPPRSTWRHEVTDSEGFYSFELLPPGTYTVMFVVPGMMLDSTAANHFTRVIQAPGDVNVTYDFAVFGSVAGLGSQLEYLSSSYYQTDAGMRNDGFVAAVAADGTSLWTVARGDVGDDLFHEVVLSSDSRTAFITSVRGNGEVFTTSVGRNQFRRVIDPTTGGTLVRVLARVSELSWTRVNMSSPPVNSAAKFLDAIDEFFATMADDPRP
ncbi:MAG: Ig-like domain-containing protein [Pirellula sp.]|nr:Ig-like domain-containing protein [Pirellula sp.]